MTIKEKKEKKDHIPIPFNDALRRILTAPPQPKIAKKKRVKKAKTEPNGR